ncbi:MAG: hypothetical protein ACREBD_07445 [Blastocatellia bacterium]
MRKIIAISCILLSALGVIAWRATSTPNQSRQYKGMRLEIHDLAEHGVFAYGPDSADFGRKLGALVAIPADLTNDAPKYSVILENRTPQRITAIAVVWHFYPAQGAPIERSSSFSFISNPFFNDVSDSLIKAGEFYPLCQLADGVGFGRARMTELKSDAQAKQTLALLDALIARSMRWSFDIDSVLFSNGVFVGPDRLGYVGATSARINAARDILKEVAQKIDAGEPMSNVLAHANAYASIPEEALDAQYPDVRKRMRDPDYIYARIKNQTAKAVLARHRNFGGDAGLIAWVRQNSQQQIQLVRQ